MSAIVHSPCAAVNVATQRTLYKQTAQGASVTDYPTYAQCALALGLVLVATDDVPPALDVDLLDIQGRRRVTLIALGMHDPIPTGPGEHLVPDLALGPHPGPQDVLPPPPVLLQRLDRLLADHAPIGHDADPADPEAGSEAIGHGDQRRHVGRVAGPELAADRPALPVQHGPYDHL